MKNFTKTYLVAQIFQHRTMKEIATLIMVGVSCIISLFDEPSSEIDDVNDISHIVDNAQFYPKGYVDTFKLHPMHFEKYKEEFEDDKKEKAE